MVPAQDVVRFAAPLAPFPSLDYVPAVVVAVVLLAMIASIVLVSVRRRDAED